MKPANISTPEKNMPLERLKSLYELIRRMNSVYNLPELLEFVIDKTLSLTDGRRGVLLLSRDKEPIPQDVAVVRGQELEKQDRERILKFVSTTVIKDVLKQGETRLVFDLPTDERYKGVTSHDTLQYKSVRSVVAVPLNAESQTVGLLYVDHPGKAVFGQDELDFLNAFAGQSALAIYRVQEHQRQIQELTQLNELSRSVVKVLDLNEVLTRIAAEVTKMLNVEACSVLLLDESSAELVFSTSVHNGQRLSISTRLKQDQGIAGWVMANGKAIFVNNVTTDSRWFGEVETGFITHSLLCVPLQMDGRTVGVLEALNKKEPQGFDPGHITLLSAFAASATIAIENARLFQEARQARQLRALNEIAMKLSGTLDLKTILNEGLAQSLAVIKADAGAITLINDPAQINLLSVQTNPELMPGFNLSSQQEAALKRFTSWLVFQKTNVFTNDEIFIIDERHPAPVESHQKFSDTGVAALAMAPVSVGDTVCGGVLIVSCTRQHIYSLEESSLLNGIARIIGLAAQNALHYLQLQAQTTHLKYLNEIGSALTRSLDPDQLLKVIIEGVNTLLQTELTSIFLVDEETNELVLRYTTRGDAEIRLPAPWQGIAGWVATHNKPALVNNTHSDPRHLRQVAAETGYKANSILCVPLKIEGQVIGVVEVLNKTGNQQFTHYHQSLLIELTKWATIALHNARLFNERVRAYQRLNAEQKRRVTAETRGAMAAIILDMAHTMNNVVGAIRAWTLNLEFAAIDTPQEPLVKYKKSILQIKKNTEEALKLMSTMTGPMEQVDVSPIDVHACLDTAVKSCWWPENVHLIKKFGVGIPQIKANSERLETVFHNLLSNAIQAITSQGGKIQISTQLTEENQVKITIVDNGPGIPIELQQRVFNPGVSSKSGSLGIGLWLVETFIHQFNGAINFVSSLHGTTFTVTLPAITIQRQNTK